MENVSIHLIRCDGLSRSDPRLSSLLSPLRKNKVSKLKNNDAAAMSIGAELALLMTLKKNSKAESKQIYYYDDNGKPQLTDGLGHINLSHSGGLAVCAFSSVPVGVDIETPRRIRPNMAAAILSPQEESGVTDSHYLLRKWTIKESYLKLTGEGISRYSMNRLTAENGMLHNENGQAAFYKLREIHTPDCIISTCSFSQIETSLYIYSAEEALAFLAE